MDDTTEPEKPEMESAIKTAPRVLVAALAVVASQVVGLLAAAAVLTTKTVTGHPGSVGRSLFGVAFALGAAAVLVLAARGLLAARRAARTPLFVLELLAIPIGYSLEFQAHRANYGLPILAGAVIVVALVFSPSVNRLLDGP